jgi:predicted homoserine dehydrogenase-like protein
MRVAAICNRTLSNAIGVYRNADLGDKVTIARSVRELDACIHRRDAAVLQDVQELAHSELIDVVVDATGALEYGSNLALAAISGRKHLVSLNAELEATVGPILKVLAERNGVLISAADGDQPAVQMRLHAFAQAVGLVPRVLGNIKGFHDVRRNPSTQRAYAEQWGQRAEMVTSFADGTKVNFEQCVVANATGFSAREPGMRGRSFAGHVGELATEYNLDEVRSTAGIVDFVVGASPAPGVFCLAEITDVGQSEYLRLFKLGPGPLYTLYTPYHLCHLEVPTTIAGVVGFGDVVANALGPPTVEVCAVAKTYIPAGAVLDGCGGYLTYGKMMNAADFVRRGLLPMGVAEGCTVRSGLPSDHLLTYEDVDVPAGRTVDVLRARQREYFSNGPRNEIGCF